MDIYIILSIILIHWIADFVLQTDKQAKGKSSNWKDLVSHTFYYSLFWMFCGVVLSGWFDLKISILFCLITFIAHTITDYFTSRLNSRLWKEGKVHNFFVSVGFDQVLHYIQLFLTYKLLF